MVYSDVVENGLIQPYKKRYNITDFKKLVSSGMSQLTARFVLLCSAAYYRNAGQKCCVPNYMFTSGFLTKCEHGQAI